MPRPFVSICSLAIGNVSSYALGRYAPPALVHQPTWVPCAYCGRAQIPAAHGGCVSCGAPLPVLTYSSTLYMTNSIAPRRPCDHLWSLDGTRCVSCGLTQKQVHARR